MLKTTYMMLKTTYVYSVSSVSSFDAVCILQLIDENVS